jgi:hypothetical protein
MQLMEDVKVHSKIAIVFGYFDGLVDQVLCIRIWNPADADYRVSGTIRSARSNLNSHEYRSFQALSLTGLGAPWYSLSSVPNPVTNSRFTLLSDKAYAGANDVCQSLVVADWIRPFSSL